MEVALEDQLAVAADQQAVQARHALALRDGGVERLRAGARGEHQRTNTKPDCTKLDSASHRDHYIGAIHTPLTRRPGGI